MDDGSWGCANATVSLTFPGYRSALVSGPLSGLLSVPAGAPASESVRVAVRAPGLRQDL